MVLHGIYPIPEWMGQPPYTELSEDLLPCLQPGTVIFIEGDTKRRFFEQVREPGPPSAAAGLRMWGRQPRRHCCSVLNGCCPQASERCAATQPCLPSPALQMHPRIKHPYILISGDGDDPSPGEYRKFIDDPK